MGLLAGIVLLAGLMATPAHAISGIRDAEIEGLLREYSDPLFRAAGLSSEAVDIYILNDPSLNAFVTGGQNIFIHTGLMLAAETPNELIGVIAHETGHIAGGHLVRTSDALAGAQIPLIVSMLAGIAAAAAGAPDAGMAILAGSQTVIERSVLAYSRGQEAAADQAAVEYLDATGQSSLGLIAFFDRFRDQEALSQRSQDPYVRTHPLNQDRVNAITERARRSPFTDVRDSPQSIARYEMAKAKLYGFLDRPDIVFRRFPAEDRSGPARYARAVAHFRLANLDEALVEVDSLIADVPANAFFHELKGQMLFESGKVAEALPHHRQAVELAPDEPLLQLNLGQALLAQEDRALTDEVLGEARDLLRAVTRAEPGNGFAWYQLAIAHARAGDDGMASLATAERHMISRNYPEAVRAAQRARQLLPERSVGWNRADDILHAVRTARGEDGRGRGPGLTFHVNDRAAQ